MMGLERLMISLKSKLRSLKMKKPYDKIEKSESMRVEIRSKKARKLVEETLKIADSPKTRSYAFWVSQKKKSINVSFPVVVLPRLPKIIPNTYSLSLSEREEVLYQECMVYISTRIGHYSTKEETKVTCICTSTKQIRVQPCEVHPIFILPSYFIHNEYSSLPNKHSVSSWLIYYLNISMD